MEPSEGAPLSKRARKKLAKQEDRKQRKQEHHEQSHGSMLAGESSMEHRHRHPSTHRPRAPHPQPAQLSATTAHRHHHHHPPRATPLLADARQLRTELQRRRGAVSDAALYAQLQRASECELFDALGSEAIERSPLFSAAPNSWRSSRVSDGGAGARTGGVGGAGGGVEGGGPGSEEEGEPAVSTTELDPDASPQARACRVVDGFLWRPHKYNEKYATQELSLLYQIYRLGGSAGGPCDVVVDVGAGNANLSCLIALALDVPVICVEMESPRAELRGEAWMPAAARAGVTRVEGFIQDYTLPSCYRQAIVVGKHLCGPGTDAGIGFVERHLPSVLGCVFATCCCCKIVGGAGAHGEGARLFGDLHFGDAASAVCPECADGADGTDGAEGEAGPGAAEGAEGAEGAEAAAGAEGAKGAKGMEGGAGRARGDARAELAAAAAAARGAGVEPDAAFFRRVLPTVARATSWRNAACNTAQREAYATVTPASTRNPYPNPKPNLHPHPNPHPTLTLRLATDPDSHPKQASYPAMLEHAEYFESWIQVRCTQ